MTITALPTPPSRDDPSTFATRADAFLGALPTFATEANALASAVNADEIAAAASATEAEASANAAAASANVTKWVSGTTYTEGANVWSPINYLTYRRKTNGAGTTDPSADSTNWAQVSGTGDVTAAGNNTFTALQTFSGSTSVAATKLANAKEIATISATAATGTINYDITTQSVLYYTSNASANWTVNFRGSSGTSLNTLMSTGESMTVAFLVTQGSTAYYNSAVQVDGSSVTPKYQGGTAWSAGNASSIDAYVYTIVKTGSAAFTVFASQTRFA
jgi:hypothetical protein